MERSYQATVLECSEELDVVGRIQFKDFADALRISKVMKDNQVRVLEIGEVVRWGRIKVHNESNKSNPDYEVFRFDTADGESYVTSSESAWRSFMEIRDELLDEEESELNRPYRFVKRDSKNQAEGFLLCQLA